MQEMPKGKNIPLGLDKVDLLPCGCAYDASTLEQWMFEKQIISNAKTKVKSLIYTRFI